MLFRRLLPLSMLVASPALAAPVPGGEVHVERTERALGCPSEQDLVKAALALGAAPLVASTTPTELVVRFDGDESSLRVMVRATGGKTGERLLRTEGADCTKLAEAAAVVVAVLLDLTPPEAAASFEVVAPATAPPTTEPPLAPAPAPPARSTPVLLPPRRAPTAKPALEALIRGAGMLTIGALGGTVTPGFGGAAAIRRARWEVALGASWLGARQVPFTQIPGTRVDLTLSSGMADGCFQLTRSLSGGYAGSLCGQVAVGRISGTGHGFDHPRAGHVFWFGMGPALAFRVRVTRVLSLRASLSGLVSLGNAPFVVDDYGTAFKSAPFSAILAAGPELSIL